MLWPLPGSGLQLNDKIPANQVSFSEKYINYTRLSWLIMQIPIVVAAIITSLDRSLESKTNSLGREV